MIVDKVSTLEQGIAEVKKMIDMAKKNMKEAQEEANYHKGAMESRYDTFKEEAQYLVAANEKRISELEVFVGLMDKLCNVLKQSKMVYSKVSLGSCFVVSNNKKIYRFFVVPFAAFTDCVIEEKKFLLINEASPVYKAFKGLSVGDFSEDDEERFVDFEVIEIF